MRPVECVEVVGVEVKIVARLSLSAVETEVKQGLKVDALGLRNGDQALVFGGLFPSRDS